MLRLREHAEQDSWSPLFKTHNLIMRAAFPPRCKQCSDCQLLVNALTVQVDLVGFARPTPADVNERVLGGGHGGNSRPGHKESRSQSQNNFQDFYFPRSLFLGRNSSHPIRAI